MAKQTDTVDRPTNPAPSRRGGNCPICGTLAVEGLWPFCSKRCANVDLARWLGGAYAIPVAEDDDEDGEEHVGPEQSTPKDLD